MAKTKAADNKDAYITKMNRQIETWQKKIQELEDEAHARHAETNDRVKKDLQDLRGKIEDTKKDLERLASAGSDWPEGSENVSEAYREMKDSARKTSSEVKPK